MGSNPSKVRTPAAAAGNTSISTSRSASVDGSVGQRASRSSSRRGSQESAGSVDTVFSVLSDLIVCHRKAAFRTVKKRFIIRGMHGGIRLERARGFKQYRKELEMLLEASGVIQNYFGTLWRFPDKQADLVRAIVVLYDDTMDAFERNLHQLEKTNDSKYEVTNETIIQLCTGRVKDLKGRLEALIPVMDRTHSTITRYIPTSRATVTLAPPEQLVPAKTERSVNISLKRRANSLHERTGGTLVERNAKVLPKRSTSAPPEQRTNALDEQSASGPSKHHWPRVTSMCT